MTATSTTSPKTDPSTDLESQREIQNALDKKRKRKSVHAKDSGVKHIKLDCKYDVTEKYLVLPVAVSLV